MNPELQIDQNGNLKHFLTIEGLKKETLLSILETAESFASVTDRNVKKVPLLRGKTVANLFFEASTRTRTTFELAAKRLSADVLNINTSNSATTKGESLLDTLRNLEAMHVDMFVVLHVCHCLSNFHSTILEAAKLSFINLSKVCLPLVMIVKGTCGSMLHTIHHHRVGT